MKRKLLSILALLFLTVTGAWADGSCGDGLTWALSSDGKTLTIGYAGSGTGAMEDYTDTNPAPWYSNRGDITSVVIKNGVTTIGEHALEGCKLTSITLPEGLTTINASAFSDNGTTIERVSIPQSVTFIGNNAFKGTSVQNFYINNIPSKIAIGETSPFKAPGVSIHVFTLMKSIFENAQNWSNYTGHFVEDIEIIHVKSITLDNMVVLSGSSGKLYATIKPGDARVKDVVYSTNSDVIHIMNPATGDFEAGADEGIATITCAAMDGSGESTSCIVSVKKSFVPAISVTLNKSNLTLVVDNSARLTATIAPANATYKNVIWTSSDEDVAEVSANGVVTAKASGVATITATSEDGAARANCEVTVKINKLNLADGSPYTNNLVLPVDELSYTRNFKNTAWQPLYIPFRLSYEDWKDDFDVAELLNIHSYDNDGDGQAETVEIETALVTEGTLKENHPYLIKAKETGTKTIFINNATIYPAESSSLQFVSTAYTCDFRGVYEKTEVPYEGGYVMNSGQFRKSNSATTINPYRFYLQITAKDGQTDNNVDIIVSSTIVASGYCGDPSVNDGKDVTYSLTGDGLLTISGTGAMACYTNDESNPAPWRSSYNDAITRVVVGDGVTSICDGAFVGCASLATVTLNSNPFIGEGAFKDIKDDATVTMNLKANLADGAYWTTFYNENYAFQADANTQVFKVTLSGTALTMHEVEDKIVDGGKPVVLKTTGGNPVMTLTTSASSNEDDNDLTGVSAPEGVATDGTFYVLNNTAANGVGFYKLAAGKTLGVGKAYLTYSGSLAREFFSFAEATDISRPAPDPSPKGEVSIYTLDGRRVSQPAKGIYIVRPAEGRLQGKNGKKVVIK